MSSTNFKRPPYHSRQQKHLQQPHLDPSDQYLQQHHLQIQKEVLLKMLLPPKMHSQRSCKPA
jgi:hypothetical protein